MAKEVKLPITLGIDPSGLSKATRGANTAAEAFLKAEVKKTSASQKELNKRQKMYEKLFNEQDKLDKKSVSDFEKAEKRKTDYLKQQQNNRIKEIEKVEKAEKKLQQTISAAANAQNQRGRMILHAGGLAAQAAGMQKTGYLMRMSGIAGIGTKTIGGMSTASLAAAGVAIGGIVVASKLVEVGLEALSSVVTSTAGAFLGAITSLGGARGLQQNIEAGAHRQDMISSAQYTVGASERSSQKDITKWAVSNAANSNLGGFTSEDWTKALNAIGTRSGIQKSFMANKSANDFIAHFALMTKDAEGKPDLAKSANLYAMFSAQNKGKSASDIQDIILAGAGIAQHGSFTAEELARHPELLAQTAGMGTDRSTAYRQVFGLTSVFAPEKGVGGANDAITAIKRGIFNTSKGGHAYSKEAAIHGQIQNLDVAAAEYSAISGADYMNMKGRGNVQSMEARNILRQHAGVNEADTFEQAKAKILTYIQSQEQGALTQQDLTDSIKDTITITSQLKTSFNRINDTMAGAFFQSLNIVATALNDWSKDFPKYQKTIEEYINGTMLAFLELVPIITEFGVILAEITGFLGKTVGAVAKVAEKKELGELDVVAITQQGKLNRDQEYLSEHFTQKNQDLVTKDKDDLQITLKRIRQLNDNIEALDKLPASVDAAVAGFNKIKDWADAKASDLHEHMSHPPPDPNVGSNLGNL